MTKTQTRIKGTIANKPIRTFAYHKHHTHHIAFVSEVYTNTTNRKRRIAFLSVNTRITNWCLLFTYNCHYKALIKSGKCLRNVLFLSPGSFLLSIVDFASLFLESMNYTGVMKLCNRWWIINYWIPLGWSEITPERWEFL